MGARAWRDRGAGTDTGHGVAVFRSFHAGVAALEALAMSQYHSGRHSADALIAGAGSWTPDNYAAAANVARAMGISHGADMHLEIPGNMEKFRNALMTQELGPAGARYARGHLGGVPPNHGRIGTVALFRKGHGGAIHMENTMLIDGGVVRRSVTRRMITAAEHSRHAPHFDGYGMFSGPDRQTNTG